MRLLSLPMMIAIVACLPNADLAPANETPQSQVDDCTSLVLDNLGQAVFGCNYDRSIDDDGLVFIHKRGTIKTGLNPSTTGVFAHWEAQYASIVFSLLGYQHAWAGMNERGLTFSTMALNSTINQPADHRPPLDWMWTQYILDTCETVEDVINTDPLVRTYTVDHYLFADRYGGVAVIEFLGGEMVAHSGEELCVAALTNSTYSSACSKWQRGDYTGHGNSIERFCLTADRVTSFSPSTSWEAVDYAFTTLRVAYSQELRWYTRWSIVFDTENLRAYFKTQRNPTVRWVDLEAFDLGCSWPAMMLDINADLSGDVCEAFTRFDAEWNAEFMQGYYERWLIPFDPQVLQSVLEFVTGFPCPRHRRPELGRARP